MIPRLDDGTQLDFKVGGVYNGMVLLADIQTGSSWDHITGECVDGQLRGSQLPVLGPLRHSTVAEVVAAQPSAELHLPRQNLLQRIASRLLFRLAGGKVLPPHFHATMGEADGRLPRHEVGLGVWTQSQARFYPLAHLRERGGVVVDRLDGRGLVVYLDPQSGSPQAIWHEAPGARIEGEVVVLGDGARLHAGKLRQQGKPESYPQLPHQTLTRWYGFSLTFHGVTIAGTTPP